MNDTSIGGLLSTIVVDAPRARELRNCGRRKRLIVIVAVAAAALIAVIAWAVIPGKHQASGTNGRARGDASRAIPVRAVAATTGSVDVTVDALGTVAALNTVTIHSRVDGPLMQVPFSEGQIVKAGDLLAQIDPRTFKAAFDQAVGTLARDEAQLAGARVDLARYKGLLAKDSVAQQQVDTQEYLVRQLVGTVESDRASVDTARLQLEFTRITAPFAGRVGLRLVDPGNIIHAADTNGLVVLTQTHPIFVVFAVPSASLTDIYPRWRKGEVLTVDALDRNNKLLSEGKLAAVDNQIDTTTGTVKLKGEFANTDDVLFPSEFVNARLKVETLSGVTLVPSASVQQGAPGAFVYVVNSDGSVALRKVTLGPNNGDLVSIQTGVKAGEQVVIDGLDKLRDGAMVAVISAAAEAPAANAPTASRPAHGAGGKATS
jgi:membrane fusion protein, multidrug efflux system